MPDRHKFIPFSRPSIDNGAIGEVVDSLKSGWITTGPKVANFESALAEYFDQEYVLALSSATAGLHLALLALELKPGDEVITCSLTFAATVNTIIHAGGAPVFVDVEDATYNMDVKALEKAITGRSRAILPVHFAGLSVDLDPLYDLAKKHKLRVIEDAAQAVGATYRNAPIGSFGDTQIFSFHPNKNMTTGEGGCLVTRSQDDYERIRHLLFHGIKKNMADQNNRLSGQAYDIAAPGFKFNMMDIQAALGLHQLPNLSRFIERRRELAGRYLTIMADWPELILPPIGADANGHAWNLFAPRLAPDAAGIARDDFIIRMRDANIGIGLHYPAVHKFSYYAGHPMIKTTDLPHTESISDNIFSLPLYPDLTNDEQDYVIATMGKILNHV